MYKCQLMFRSWVLRRWPDIEPAWIDFLFFGCSLHFWSRSCSPDSDIEPVSLGICDIDHCSCFLAVSVPQWFLNFRWLLNLFMMWILFSAFWYGSCSLHFWGGSCSCVLAVRVFLVISEPFVDYWNCSLCMMMCLWLLGVPRSIWDWMKKTGGELWWSWPPNLEWIESGCRASFNITAA